MPYLQQLWLNHNRLTRLPISLPPSVRRLLVESNSIRAVSEETFPVEESQLVALSLAGNHISTLQRGDLRRLQLLRALDLSVNNIRRLPADVFSDNTHLRSLQLSRNPLSHLLPGCFSGLKALRRLSLAFVPSVEVNLAPDAFGDLPALTALDLDSSPAIARSLMESDSLLFRLSGVQELGLLNTQLTGLRPDLPGYFPSLVVIRLSSSRWHCDAPAAAWMRSWMASTGVEVIGVGEIVCLTPPEVRGRSLLTLADWELDGARGAGLLEHMEHGTCSSSDLSAHALSAHCHCQPPATFPPTLTVLHGVSAPSEHVEPLSWSAWSTGHVAAHISLPCSSCTHSFPHQTDHTTWSIGSIGARGAALLEHTEHGTCSSSYLSAAGNSTETPRQGRWCSNLRQFQQPCDPT